MMKVLFFLIKIEIYLYIRKLVLTCSVFFIQIFISVFLL